MPRHAAAFTDAERAAEVLAAADAVFAALNVWRAWLGWREDDIGRRLQRIADTARAAVAALPDRGDLTAAVAAVMPLLAVWWPSWPPPYALSVAAVVEQLRIVALHRAVTPADDRDDHDSPAPAVAPRQRGRDAAASGIGRRFGRASQALTSRWGAPREPRYARALSRNGAMGFPPMSAWSYWRDRSLRNPTVTSWPGLSWP